METKKRFTKGTVVKGTRSSGNKGKAPAYLLSLDLDSQVELKDVYKRLKAENYIVKPILKALESNGFNLDNIYEELEETDREVLKQELILENFFKNLASTGSFCYFRKVKFCYTEELTEFFHIKGAQVNYIEFEKGKYNIDDKSCPYYKK
jgi:hypothetical protein